MINNREVMKKDGSRVTLSSIKSKSTTSHLKVRISPRKPQGAALGPSPLRKLKAALGPYKSTVFIRISQAGSMEWKAIAIHGNGRP